MNENTAERKNRIRDTKSYTTMNFFQKKFDNYNFNINRKFSSYKMETDT